MVKRISGRNSAKHKMDGNEEQEPKDKKGHWSVVVAEGMLACGLTGWWMSCVSGWNGWRRRWRGVCGVREMLGRQAR